MAEPSSEPVPREAAEALGDADALRLLSSLVALAPTNLEDPGRGRWEKPNYAATADRIVRAARAAGLRTRLFDPLAEGVQASSLRNIPRPNVIADLDVGAPERVLILAHYDVVPVPEEQRPRWKTPPHTLSARSDGRLYGRGANDDLGSGVVASLLALRRLAEGARPPRNVRFIAACDEESGGDGGVEAIKAYDERFAPDDPARILTGDAVLIPDGGPRATAGSSGVAFLSATIVEPEPLASHLAFGRELVRLHELARTWRSVYRSPDYPEHGAPEPVIAGRATVTQWQFEAEPSAADRLRLVAARAESDAANQIPRVVTLAFTRGGPSDEELDRALATVVIAPYRIARDGATSLRVPPEARVFQVVGQSAHGGYPHLAHNPVPAAIDLLERLARTAGLDTAARGRSTFSVDLRLTPEMALDAGRGPVLERLRGWSRVHLPGARVEAPDARCRRGYALPVDHPVALRLERILRAEFGVEGIMGEYGGTDASALVGLTTPQGAPLPAMVFGSMDREAHIHEAEESVDPRLLAGVARTIERFVREP